MSNPDKHKPLSPEELFKLLDNTSDKASDFDELDDFEKEALEGFSAHSDSQKAKDLTDELNLAISKKAGESNSGGTKNRIIWFSAAASIVLIIMVSVFFFNESKKDSATNIALNELKEDKAPELLIEESKAIEAKEAPGKIPDAKTATQSYELSKNVPLKDQTVLSNKNAEGESFASAMSPVETTRPTAENKADNKPTLALSEKAAKDEAKNRSDYDDLKKQETTVSDNLAIQKKEKISLEQEEVNNELQANQNIATTSSNESTRITKEENGYYKGDSDGSVAAKKRSEKEKVFSASPGSKTKQTVDAYDKSNAEPVGGNVASGPASTINTKTMSAYYTGSEIAIRDYVINYLKGKTTKQIVGKYKVMATISVNGTLKVNSLAQITREYCACEDSITEALNTMTKWNPAQEGGKKVSSVVSFIIVF